MSFPIGAARRWIECGNCEKWIAAGPPSDNRKYCNDFCTKEHQRKLLRGEDKVSVIMAAIEAEVRKHFK